MRRMKLSRLGVGTSLAIGALTAWLGACSSNNTESCGKDGVINGTCQAGTSCPSGSAIELLSDPVNSCPDTYVCCVPSDASAPASNTGG
jgi:hypothetical protein